MQAIKLFCEQKGITLKKFAANIGVSPPFITQITKGLRRPSPDIALKIQNATNGEVTVLELLFPKENI